jgi:putative ABC transport system permease protein
MLLKKPGFTLVAVCALALGIGANTTIFSVVNAALIDPVPYPEPSSVVSLYATFASDPGDETIKTVSYPDFLDFRTQSGAFEDMAAVDGMSLTLTGGDEPERLRCALVSASLFSVLRVRPSLGRSFDEGDDRAGATPVVILSHGLWQRRFGSDPEILGEAITLSRTSYNVIGVMPSGFTMPNGLTGGPGFDLWLPVTPTAHKRPRTHHRYEAYARLKPGVTLQEARQELSAIAAGLEATYPDSNKGKGVKIEHLRELVVRDSRSVLLIMLGAVGFVLLIACANVANLMLARATTRRKEIAVRASLGASRRRIIQQLLIESLLLAFIGGSAGLLIALWGSDVFVSMRPAGIPRLSAAGIDGRVLGFTATISLLTGILFGLAPALHASKPDLVASLKETVASSTAGSDTTRLRSLLVVSEVALAVVLLIGAGLMLKSFLRLQGVDTGMETENLLTFQLSLPQTDYPKEEQARAFYERLIERLGSAPGVESVAAVNILPLGGGFSCDSFARDDRPVPQGQEPCAEYRSISSGYFRSMGIELLSGRAFSERDRVEAPAVAMINEAFAREFFPGEDPLGRRITSDTGKRVSREIVGVVRDIKHFGLDSEARPELYVPYTQDPWPRAMTIVLRTGADPSSLMAGVRAEVSALDKDLPVLNVRTMEQLVERSVSTSRFRAYLIGLFAALALILSSLGIYGVMSYAAGQRTHEIGIRMALGAGRRDILTLVLGQGVALTMIGIGIGVAASLGLTRVLQSMLFEVSATDPYTFAGVSILLFLVAVLACLLPARRAMNVDPTTALRCE